MTNPTGMKVVAWRLVIPGTEDKPFTQFVTDPGFADNLRSHGLTVTDTSLVTLAEAEAFVADALRYRYLRSNCTSHPDEYATGEQLYFGTYAAGNLDAEIDAALSKLGEKGNG